ncbi:MAG TPA: Smr/MutS family protein, partial [Beijerinckiaceae bacterium]
MRRRPHQRSLTASEQELWRTVTRFVARLDGGRALARPPDEPAPAAAADPPTPAPGLPAAPPPPATPKARSHPPLAVLETKVRKRLARGRLDVDAKLDLHGMRQAEAHMALKRFLQRAQDDGARVVLVV